MSFLNPANIARGVKSAGSAIAGRSYFEGEDGRLVSFDEHGVHVFGAERPDDDRDSQQAKGV